MDPKSEPCERATILVVDDEVAVRKSIGALIRQAGYQVILAASAGEALEQMSRQAAQLVLSDLRMPEVDGLGLVERLVERWPGVPIILLTAHGTVPDAVAAVKRGAHDFLLKPCDRQQLLAKIEEALRSPSIERPGARIAPPPSASSETTSPSGALSADEDDGDAQSLQARKWQAERRALEAALAACDQSRTEAARLLGVSRRTLYYRLQAHGLLARKSP